jgi:hypothetical protein
VGVEVGGLDEILRSHPGRQLAEPGMPEERGLLVGEPLGTRRPFGDQYHPRDASVFTHQRRPWPLSQDARSATVRACDRESRRAITQSGNGCPPTPAGPVALGTQDNREGDVHDAVGVLVVG